MSLITIVSLIILASSLRWVAFPQLGVKLMMTRVNNVEKFDLLEISKVSTLTLVPLILSQNHGMSVYSLVVAFLGYYTMKWIFIRLTYGEIGF